jgi:hypothetical protein
MTNMPLTSPREILMKTAFLVTLAAVLVGLPSYSAWASDSTKNSLRLPKCASRDSVVGVNTAKKMYMTQAQMNVQYKGMTPAQMHGQMSNKHISMMCLSKAKAMGASSMALGAGNSSIPGGTGNSGAGSAALHDARGKATTPGGIGATGAGSAVIHDVPGSATLPGGTGATGAGSAIPPVGTGNSPDPGSVSPR